MSKHILVSFVIPCYNDAGFIEQAVNSALNQTYDNIEIIIVDDGSNLKTKKILKTLEPKVTYLLQQENMGQSRARNVGIKKANGSLIVNLDSDDFFENTFVEKAIIIFNKSDDVVIVTAKTKVINEDESIYFFTPKGGAIDSFLFSNASTGSAMFLKSRWRSVGGYDESMRKGWEDWEFYIRLMHLGGICHIIKEHLFNYRKRSDSTTNIANKNKYDLYSYIFNKHQSLYKNNFSSTVEFLIRKVESEENQKYKRLSSLEFKIGEIVLSPLRWLIRVFK